MILMSTSLFAQTYTYLDGSANKYEISSTKIIYSPVTPAKSSSGDYSGGVPETVEINSEIFKKIKSLIDEAVKAKTEQIEHREMGTGVIMWKKKKKENTVIMQMNSPKKEDLEKYLKEILTQN
jgi:hypothetical protein